MRLAFTWFAACTMRAGKRCGLLCFGSVPASIAWVPNMLGLLPCRCCSPFSYFVIRQTAYTHVSSCRTWLSDSQEAYVKAAEALTGLNTVQVKCQVANRYNERRILIVAVTTPTTLKEARSLSSKMNDAVQDGTFRTLVSVQDGAASLPTRETEGGCVLGFDECPKDYLTQRSRHV